jgi:hypothetical protein
MAVSIEFVGTVLDTISFFLVTPDLVGKERITRAGRHMRTAVINIFGIPARLILSVKRLFRSRWFDVYRSTIGALFLILIVGSTTVELLESRLSLHLPSGLVQAPGYIAMALIFMIIPIIVLLTLAFPVAMFVLLGYFILLALSAYSFSGILLAIGIVCFLIARGLSLYSAWPF